MTVSAILTDFSDMIRKKDGNFAIVAALTVPLMFMAGSLAIDTSNAMSMKTRLQNAVDSAALATSTHLMKEGSLTVLEAKAFAEKFLDGQLQDDMSAFTDLSVEPTVTVLPEITASGIMWKVSVALRGTQTLTPMARFLGQDKISVNVVGKAQSGSESSKGSLSMALVLDKSGSMGWTMDGQIKINVLKTAVVGLLSQFELADPDGKYVRVGGASYDTKIDKRQNMKWGTKYAGKFVNKLKAKGGTDSTDAFKWAYKKVTNKKEDKQHLKITGQTPTKYIVFMSDGDNNYISADSSTKILCDSAKSDGVKIYSVAFAAPARGKALLSYCASAEDYFFDAKNSAELIAAFKNIGQQTSEVVSRLTE